MVKKIIRHSQLIYKKYQNLCLWKGLDWTYEMQVSNLLFSDDFILRRSPLMFIIECNWKLFPHFKCRLKMSLPIYPIKPITWMKFLLQLSEWKNYCHFLWLSIYILLLGFAARFTSTRNFSARIISKSNFSFQLGKTSWLPHVAVILWPKWYYLV